MESTNNQGNGRSFWALLAGAGAFFVILGGLAATWLPQQRRRREAGIAGRLRGIAGRSEMRRTTAGIGASLGQAWEAIVGGVENVRAPHVGESIAQTQRSFTGAINRTRHTVLSFVASTIWTTVWVSIAGIALLFIYLPDPNRRQRFINRGREYLNRARRQIG